MKYNGKKFLSDIKFYNDYSKWKPELGRYENWEEAVEDVISIHREKYSKYSELTQYLDHAENLYKQKVVLASQRNLQFRKDQVFNKNERLYNCFGEETEFVTSKGVKSFKDFKSGDSCRVLSHNGIWQNAIVKNYGKQELYELSFYKTGTTKKIRATRNHRWLLRNNTETTNIEIGDKVLRVPNTFKNFDWDNSTIEEKLYWCYGMVYGDGTITKNKNNAYTMLRLCGNDSKFENRFLEMGFKSSSSLSLNGDVMVYTGKYDKKSPNPEIDSPELITAFVSGYLQADGTKTRNKNGKSYISIQSSDGDHIDFIKKCFPVAGQYIMNDSDLTGQSTNFSIRGYTKKFGLSEGTNGHTDSYWTLKEINPIGFETVWCLEVENDYSFTLANGIVTGNCVTTYLDDIEKIQKAFFLSLCGCGVTLNLHKKWTKKLPKVIKRNYDDIQNFIIPDSIEGWADSVGVLLSSFCDGDVPFPEYQGKVVRFDYSKIRPKGSMISGGFKAPGPDGLKQSLERIETLLINAKTGKQLKTIDAYDCLMHCADATLSGGVRRAAMAVMIDPTDKEMLNAKVGNWRETNKQRERSNNSVILKRGSFSKKELEDLIKVNGGMSDLGFTFVENEYITFNPCVTGDTVIELAVKNKDNSITQWREKIEDSTEKFEMGHYTKNDNIRIKCYNVETKEYEFMPFDNIVLTKFVNELIELEYENKKITVTPEHKIYTTNRGYIEAQYLKEDDELVLSIDIKEENMIKINRIKSEKPIPVYDVLGVEDNHNFFANDILVHNCFEIGMTPILDYETEETGYQFCNLTEINAKACMKNGKLNKELFLEACKAASSIGTLQAGYTKFPYIGKASEKITEREALIGVSITGWMDNPELFDEEILKEGVDIVNKTNEEVAKIIGINPAARTTAVKPSGNACTKIETKIKTEKGIMTMEEVFNYISDNSFEIENMPEKTFITPEKSLKVYDENNELKDIISFYINGIQEVYDIKFEDGNVYSFTENHKLKTKDGWKYVKDLTEEDIILSY